MSYTTLAVTTSVIAVVSSEAKYLAEKKPMEMKPVIGGFILGMFLFAFGMVNENVATKFCYLVIVTAILMNGSKLFSILK
jgi:hypothetical protein